VNESDTASFLASTWWRGREGVLSCYQRNPNRSSKYRWLYLDLPFWPTSHHVSFSLSCTGVLYGIFLAFKSWRRLHPFVPRTNEIKPYLKIRFALPVFASSTVLPPSCFVRARLVRRRHELCLAFTSWTRPHPFVLSMNQTKPYLKLRFALLTIRFTWLCLRDRPPPIFFRSCSLRHATRLPISRVHIMNKTASIRPEYEPNKTVPQITVRFTWLDFFDRPFITFRRLSFHCQDA
jgi:hypothetical protein